MANGDETIEFDAEVVEMDGVAGSTADGDGMGLERTVGLVGWLAAEWTEEREEARVAEPSATDVCPFGTSRVLGADAEVAMRGLRNVEDMIDSAKMHLY